MLLEAGYAYAREHLPFLFDVKPWVHDEPQVVMNGNQAIAYGAVAAGMDLAAMYPITPATSVSHQLGEMFYKFGGVVHQAEDEIAACAFAIGASYAGKCTVTITSGPGYSLKQEAIGLAVMAEIPLVVVNVQRGGPSTGLPTKVEQGEVEIGFSEDAVFLALGHLLHAAPVHQVLQADLVQIVKDPVAQVGPQIVGQTLLMVLAIGRAAAAGRVDGLVHGRDHVGDDDLFGRTAEAVAPARAPCADHQPLLAQAGEQLLEIR